MIDSLRQTKLYEIESGFGNFECYFTCGERLLVCEIERYALDIFSLTFTHNMCSGTKLLDLRWSLSFSQEFLQEIGLRQVWGYLWVLAEGLAVGVVSSCLLSHSQLGQRSITEFVIVYLLCKPCIFNNKHFVWAQHCSYEYLVPGHLGLKDNDGFCNCTIWINAICFEHSGKEHWQSILKSLQKHSAQAMDQSKLSYKGSWEYDNPVPFHRVTRCCISSWRYGNTLQVWRCLKPV